MTQFLAVLSGLVISVMVLINSELSVVYGTALATVIIHVVGLALIGVITAFAKKPPRQKAPWYLLCGGFVGVFLTYSNIYTVTAAGVSLTVALGLLGQCILSLLIDSFGWFGVPRQRFGLKRIGGLVLIAAGATAMLLLDGGLQQLSGGLAGQPILAIVVMGVLGGASNVFSRMLNAGLADRVGVYRSTLVNYITGLALSALILLILRPALAAPPALQGPMDFFMYLGGALGVVVVVISNMVALRLSSLVMTLLVFISQLATGILLDFIRTGTLPLGQLVGAVLLLAGLLLYRNPAKRNTEGPAPAKPGGTGKM
ncbi:MAG: DMT family transporter [Ruminococcaceae bacterium]|nr:DMT family transporter [Oscillospiraceae bacterium]